MIVPNVLGGLQVPTKRFQHAESFDMKAAARGLAVAAQSKLSSPTSAMRQVVSQYDMTKITPNSFANLVQQLTAHGAVSQKDAQQLAAIPGDLENSGVSPDEAVNVLDFYQQQITKAQDSAAQSPSAATPSSNFTQLMGRMQWVAKFAMLRQQGSSSGVNAVA